MIRAEHIFKSFDGRTVLDDISVEFETCLLYTSDAADD